MAPKAAWALALGLLILNGCGPQQYAILKGTSHPNPPTEPLRVLVMPFKQGRYGPKLAPQGAVQAVHQRLTDELGREKVEIVEEVAAGPGSLRPMRQVRRVSNPFRAVHLSAEDSTLVGDIQLDRNGAIKEHDLEVLRRPGRRRPCRLRRGGVSHPAGQGLLAGASDRYHAIHGRAAAQG